MRYRIEYADGRCCNFANSRKDLLEWLRRVNNIRNRADEIILNELIYV